MYSVRIVGRSRYTYRLTRFPLRPVVNAVRMQLLAPKPPVADHVTEVAKNQNYVPPLLATEVAKPVATEVAPPVTTEVAKVQSEPGKPVVKQTIWEKVKHEAQHYWDGTKLLGYEMKVLTKLLVKYMAGYALTRRELSQLQRTLVDVLKLLPFAMFVLIPFAELLLPVALKIFPNLLPLTYELLLDRLKKRNKLSKTRNLALEYIKKTLEESNGLKLLKKISDKEREAFVSFFDIILMGKNPLREHLVQVARMFKNDQVLDNLSRNQLVAMCKYMLIRPFGSDAILRYQIRHRLLTIIKDDKVIDYEGVETLLIPELQMACSQRGIKTGGKLPARMRDDLETWLELRLRQKIPLTLLILSNLYAYGEQLGIDTYYDALLAVLLSIPDEVYNVAKAQLSDDSKQKLRVLKEQEELIQEENQREKGTINAVKDDINLDEYEETATDGIVVVNDEADTIKEDTDALNKKEDHAPKEEKKN